MSAVPPPLPEPDIGPPDEEALARGPEVVRQAGEAEAARVRREGETLEELLARLHDHPPPPTRFLRRTYTGRANVEPPPLARGIAAPPPDLAAALAELPDRRSRLRGGR